MRRVHVERKPINTDRQGCALCIGRSYQKNKDKIAKRLSGGYSYTGVIEIVRYEADNNDRIPQ